MHGALLRTGKSDEFIAVGETGQPVYKAALQLIAALTRKSPSLVNFLAVPKSNEQGSVIDWYSPIQGDVVPWSSATEAERDVARTQLNHFKTAIAEMSASLVQAGSKGGQSDQIIFGKLLGLVPHAPADSYVYLVEATRTNAEGAVERYSQPILTFWGFVQNEGDRHRDPLYFLTPRAATPAPSPPANHARAGSSGRAAVCCRAGSALVAAFLVAFAVAADPGAAAVWSAERLFANSHLACCGCDVTHCAGHHREHSAERPGDRKQCGQRCAIAFYRERIHRRAFFRSARRSPCGSADARA